jgi:hypothetical protein
MMRLTSAVTLLLLILVVRSPAMGVASLPSTSGAIRTSVSTWTRLEKDEADRELSSLLSRLQAAEKDVASVKFEITVTSNAVGKPLDGVTDEYSGEASGFYRRVTKTSTVSAQAPATKPAVSKRLLLVGPRHSGRRTLGESAVQIVENDGEEGAYLNAAQSVVAGDGVWSVGSFLYRNYFDGRQSLTDWVSTTRNEGGQLEMRRENGNGRVAVLLSNSAGQLSQIWVVEGGPSALVSSFASFNDDGQENISKTILDGSGRELRSVAADGRISDFAGIRVVYHYPAQPPDFPTANLRTVSLNLIAALSSEPDEDRFNIRWLRPAQGDTFLANSGGINEKTYSVNPAGELVLKGAVGPTYEEYKASLKSQSRSVVLESRSAIGWTLIALGLALGILLWRIRLHRKGGQVRNH